MKGTCPECGHEDEAVYCDEETMLNATAMEIVCSECGYTYIQPSENHYIQKLQVVTHRWRMNKWPDLEVWKQFGGFVGEIAEFIEILFKGEFYDEEWDDREELKKEAGDVIIYFLGVLSLLDLDVHECIEAAREKNNNRDWDEHQQR